MAEFYLGQIMMTGFSFAQKYFAQCNGQILPVAQNQALFSLFGTYYGGNGSTNFALPDLRGRTPIGAFQSQNQSWSPPPTVMGQKAGTETVTLTTQQMPIHTHMVIATTATGTSSYPDASMTLGALDPNTALLYGPQNSLTAMGAGPLAPTGGNQPHPNLQPYDVINFNVALQGVFPSRG